MVQNHFSLRVNQCLILKNMTFLESILVKYYKNYISKEINFRETLQL
jgi:hypothetical protein